MPIYQRPLRPDELMHYGVKGMKWGVKNGPPYPLNQEYSKTSPKQETKNGDYIYKKGTVVGRCGEPYFDNPLYLFTNEKDREVYKRNFGDKEYKFRLTKNIKTPNKVSQIVELYNYTKDPEVLNDPFEYWKDTINTFGPTADGYFKHMKKKGYDGLVDIRNAGVISDDPILLLNPKKHLKEVN